jgi:hypothetical protein
VLKRVRCDLHLRFRSCLSPRDGEIDVVTALKQVPMTAWSGRYAAWFLARLEAITRAVVASRAAAGCGPGLAANRLPDAQRPDESPGSPDSQGLDLPFCSYRTLTVTLARTDTRSGVGSEGSNQLALLIRTYAAS